MEMLSSMLSRMLFSAVLLIHTRHVLAVVLVVSVSVFTLIGTSGGTSSIFFCGVGIVGIAFFFIRLLSGDPERENQS